MIHAIDPHKLNLLHDAPFNYADPSGLRREGGVFLIGGNLPLYATLETMYESYCLEATDLFHITFGDAEQFVQNLEMVRQIKRNFSIRLMGRISFQLSESEVDQTYLAGLDVLDLPQGEFGNYPAESFKVDEQLDGAFRAATATFSRWSAVSTIVAGRATAEEIRKAVHFRLERGVIPLLQLSGSDSRWDPAEAGDLFLFLAAEWHRYRVPLKPIIPLLRLTTPFEFSTSSRFQRAFDRFQDRRIITGSDIRRHLRTSGAVASFESAGL